MNLRLEARLKRTMPNIFDYTDHRLFLRDAYQAKHAKDYSFSHRHIVACLGVKSVAVFQHFLTGRNVISDKHVKQLAAIFELNKKEAEFFELLVRFNQATKAPERRDLLSELSGFVRANQNLVKPLQYAFYDQWYYSAVRAALSYYDFKGDYAELASLFNPPVTMTQARHTLRLLEDLGLVRRDSDGFPRPTTQLITTGNQADAVALSKHLIQMLDLARGALDNVPREHRELSSITLSLSEQTLELVRKEITRCRYRLLDLVRKDPSPDRVYQASFQIFPLTKLKKKSHEIAL
jgi:uncharacterized protein (TIGR02147 family)